MTALGANAQTTTTESATIREDVTDLINNIDPTETPILSMARSSTARQTTHEWIEDTLRDPSTDLTVAEGEGYAAADAFTAGTTPSKIDNVCQINAIAYGVSGTVEVVGKYGRDSELAYEGAKASRDLKNAVDYDIAGRNQAKDTGSPRGVGCLGNYLSNVQTGATGSASTGDGSDVWVDGTDAAFTSAMIDTAMETAYDDGAKPRYLVTTAKQKGVFSTFDGLGTAVTRSDRQGQTVYANADVYVSNFGTLDVLPSRHVYTDATADAAFLIDPEYLKIAYLRPWQQFDLAKIGDSMRREMLVEWTLEVCHRKSHAMITALLNT